jgi:hypothetical protein
MGEGSAPSPCQPAHKGERGGPGGSELVDRHLRSANTGMLQALWRLSGNGR